MFRSYTASMATDTDAATGGSHRPGRKPIVMTMFTHAGTEGRVIAHGGAALGN
jgi:hypothetical protein